MPIFFIASIAVVALGAGIFFYSTQSSAGDGLQTNEQARPVEEVSDTNEAEVTNNPDLDTEDTQPNTNEEATATPASTIEAEQNSTFNDGTFTATATYLTPRRTPHDVSVTLTITNDVITDVDVLYDGDKNFANQQQGWFENEIGGIATGVRLDELSVSRVGGASLTTRAFNEAVAEIRTSAQS